MKKKVVVHFKGSVTVDLDSYDLNYGTGYALDYADGDFDALADDVTNWVVGTLGHDPRFGLASGFVGVTAGDTRVKAVSA